MIGQTIAHFEITAKIGEGGMGEVYQATDTKLNREVALKVLPESFAQDPQRMGRFQREAQVLASLNHPNIAAIYGLESVSEPRREGLESRSLEVSSPGQAASLRPQATSETPRPRDHETHCLVMELVEGEDLSERIARGPIPIDEALPIALQIAEALEDAHEKGIIHRDLKPANIKLTPEGKVKVLDFGLAKALEGDPTSSSDIANSPTLTIQATQAGMILGTVAYMSPEQARGKTADKRADIWSFGVVLYEMLTGQGMFDGETISDSLARVLQAPLDFSTVPDRTPPAIRRLLRRCLERDRKHRLRDIGDARIEIEEALRGPQEQVRGATPVPSANPRWSMTALAVTVALVAGLAIGWLAWKGGPLPEIPYRRFTIATANVGDAKISPDGRHVAYEVLRQGQSVNIWLRDIESDNSREIAELPWSYSSFAWSPKSDAIVFNMGDELTKFSLTSGATVTLCNLETRAVGGLAWSPDGEIIVLSSSSRSQARLFEVLARGGSPRPLFEADTSEQPVRRYAPHFLPSQSGRRALLYTEADEIGANGRIMLWDMAGDERRELVAGIRPAYSPTGHILYQREVGLWALPFSIDSLTVTGEAFLIRQGADSASVARDGTLVYRESDDDGPQQLVWKSREGRTLGTIGQPQVRIWGPRISPDGKSIAVHGVDNGNQDIWIHDTARSVKMRLTSDPAQENRTIWSPDGRHIIFSSNRNGDYDVFVRATDGSGEERALFGMSGDQWAMDWSADGKYLIVDSFSSGQPQKLFYVEGPLEREAREPALLLGTESSVRDSSFSPDGKYVAYTSNETGREEVFVQRFPELGGKVQVSINSGSRPRWRADGKEMYFVQEVTLIAVPVSTAPDFTVGNPEILFEHSNLRQDGGQQYDVSADGQRFVVMESVNPEEQATVRLVQNWFAEFRDQEERE